jgi:hypothetical protein
MLSKDPQAKRVYEMEWTCLEGHVNTNTPLHMLRKVARNLCKEHGVPYVRIFVRSFDHECDAMYTEPGIIKLDPTRGKNLLTLAHELAHHICSIKNPRAQPHGATWVKIYAGLLSELRLVPIAGMKAICKAHKVRMA